MIGLVVGLVAALAAALAPSARSPAGVTPGARAARDPVLYGVTIDRVSHLSAIVFGAEALPERSTTRVYFDVHEPASHYLHAVRVLAPHTTVMGELLDSSDERSISVGAFGRRVASYLRMLGPYVSILEVGNEVNGNWTGPYTSVTAKLTEADELVSRAGGQTALTSTTTLVAATGGPSSAPMAFSEKYLPPTVRRTIDYVLLSYYEPNCGGRRPSAAAWTAEFTRLHQLYPAAAVGFGEVGLDRPVRQATLRRARSIMAYYYGLKIPLDYYVGGYFWWYSAED